MDVESSETKLCITGNHSRAASTSKPFYLLALCTVTSAWRLQCLSFFQCLDHDITRRPSEGENKCRYPHVYSLKLTRNSDHIVTMKDIQVAVYIRNLKLYSEVIKDFFLFPLIYR